jgi:hypothetical protein
VRSRTWEAPSGSARCLLACNEPAVTSVDEVDAAFAEQFGVRKSTVYAELVGPVRLPSGIALEVGCRMGMHLEVLGRANPGLERHGVDPDAGALARAGARQPGVRFHLGSPLALPVPDRAADLVLTHGALSRLSPRELPQALAEIRRVSRRYILCHEPYAPTLTQEPCPAAAGAVWRANFAERCLSGCQGMRAVAVRYYPYTDPCGGQTLVDQVALLEWIAP